jgi:hypothetical protein
MLQVAGGLAAPRSPRHDIVVDPMCVCVDLLSSFQRASCLAPESSVFRPPPGELADSRLGVGSLCQPCDAVKRVALAFPSGEPAARFAAGASL